MLLLLRALTLGLVLFQMKGLHLGNGFLLASITIQVGCHQLFSHVGLSLCLLGCHIVFLLLQ